MTAGSGNVLVLDGMWNKSLAAVRSLAKKGLRVTAGECTRLSTALFSRHCAFRFVHPSPAAAPAAFLDALGNELARGNYDAVFPMEWSTQELLTEPANRALLERYAKIPYADAALARQLNDKSFVMQQAEAAGIATPRTWHPQSAGEVREIADEVRYPLLIKPRSSSGSRGILRVTDSQNLMDEYQRVHRLYPLPILQEQISPGGDSFGVCVMMNAQSEVRASFVYRKLRQYPVQGGPSTLRESIRRDDILESAVKFLRSAGWQGVAHIEFMIDPKSGVPKLIEVNPRFWGSLALAIEAGVDFPYLLYRMAVDGDIPVSACDYAEGVRCRWLLPGDLLHFLANRERFRLHPGFFDFRSKDDILSLSDPLPAFGRMLSILPFMFKPDMRRLLFRRLQ